MTANNLFPLKMNLFLNVALKSEVVDEARLWHLRCGHLNHKGLTLLRDMNMVMDLPKIQPTATCVCEGCVYEKQHRLPFHNTSWRAKATLELQGIRRQLTVKYSSQSNGVAERKNMTIVEMARRMLKGKGLLNSVWAEVVNTTACTLNRSPTKVVQNKTPYEARHKKKPLVDHLKVFGCVAYALLPKKKEKFDEKSKKLIFIGYSEESKGYHLFDPKTNNLVISRDVIFDENAEWKWVNESSQTQQTFSYREAPVFTK
ncbi:hypothetical protein MLD38_021316 [Melastoma candidum]|uniref:Uncharacterized protein n=1 Tax=Melastoma candidum TaxID=119954 RepID=A0ACB9QF51_9MYRT|nr:hypothetical protein MLD38_021316 [Melastoma candidum]